MAFAKTGKVNGDDQVYELRDSIKRFTLRDLGFVEEKPASFHWKSHWIQRRLIMPTTSLK